MDFALSALRCAAAGLIVRSLGIAIGEVGGMFGYVLGGRFGRDEKLVMEWFCRLDVALLGSPLLRGLGGFGCDGLVCYTSPYIRNQGRRGILMFTY